MLNIFGIPTTLGCNKKGSENAPMYLREGNLFEALNSSKLDYLDFGDVYVNNDYENTEQKNIKLKNLEKIKDLSEDIYTKILSNTKKEDKVLCIGGDHSMAIGTVFASAERFDEIALIWIDAHADSNSPETSLTGNIHGMPLSTVMGDSLFKEFNHNPVLKKNVYLVGIKDVDDAEWDYLNKNNITYYTMDDVVEKGIGNIWRKINLRIGNLPIHVSLDIDGLDWDIAPGTGIINNGGLNYREIKYLSKKISEKNLISLDVAEINPLNDINHKTQDLAVELICDFYKGKWTNYEKYLFTQNTNALKETRTLTS